MTRTPRRPRSGTPALRHRIAARRAAELPTLQLEAFRRAGGEVYEVCLLADRRRDELRAAGRHPFDADPATASLLLAVWNARVHQLLAEQLLDSDQREDPGTRGFVPAVTHRQAWALFQPVAAWLLAARRAAVNPGYWIGDEVQLPAPLPELLRPAVEPGKHLKGMLSAADALEQLLQQELGAVASAGPVPAAWQQAGRRIEELAAQARTSVQYAQGLWHPGIDPALREVVRGHLYPALVLQHHLGQYLALPEVLDAYRTRPVGVGRRAQRG